MAFFYLDTSALLKYYREERGSPVLHRLLDTPGTHDHFCFSFLAVLELVSAVTRLRRARLIPDEVAQETLASARQDAEDFFDVWPLREDILVGGIPLAEEYALRAADTIHLATAIAVSEFAGGLQTLILVAADREILSAARTAGFVCLNPEADDALDELVRIRALG